MLQTAHKPLVTVLHRSPFTLGAPDIWHWPADQTIAQIVARTPLPDKADFMRRGIVMINGHEISRGCWHVVRARAENGAIVTLHMPVRGGPRGSGGQGKQVAAIVAAIAITIASAGAVQGWFAVGTMFVKGSLSAALLGAAISFAGSILVASLSSAPMRQQDSSDTKSGDAARLEPAAVQGNLLQPNSPIPRVIGTRRIFPPLIGEPTPEYIGQDEIVHAVYALAGPHALELPRFGDATYDVAGSGSDLFLQMYDGRPGSTVPSYPSRYSRTMAVGVELSTHGTDSQNLAVFAPPLPLWHATATADSPDECWLHFSLAGLLRNASPSDPLRIPFRIRLRRRGDANWRYLPELHYMDATQSQRRFQVKFRFGESFTGPYPKPGETRGWIEARKQVPAQNVSPAGAVWDADSYFSNGSGNHVYSASTYTTTNIRHIDLQPDAAIVYLSAASWPAGIYDIEVMRGATFRNADFTSSTYTYSGSVLDFFGSRDTGLLPLTHDGLFDRVDFVRAVSVRNRAPIIGAEYSLMYVKATNRQVGNFSVEASGYVYDYNGSSWSDFTTTSNPAPHFRDMLVGTLNFNAMPELMLDDDSLIEWRDVCEANGYRCDLVVESGAIFDTLRVVASCGYARPYQSELWGVIRDYDRSSEPPIQIFSSRNTRNFSWQKAFPRLPDGLRVNYKAENADYAERQVVVYRNDVEQLNASTEQITYEGLVDRDQVIDRATFDLAQAQLRSAIYSFDAPVESIVCRRGSLIGLNHDILLNHTGSARVTKVVRDTSGDVVAVHLDATIDLRYTGDMLSITDMLAVPDMLDVGIQSAVAIRHTNGNNSIHVVTSDGETDIIEFAEPYSDTRKIKVGCLLVCGAIGKEYKRLIVSEISPASDLTATLTLVDEAPELWAA